MTGILNKGYSKVPLYIDGQRAFSYTAPLLLNLSFLPAGVGVADGVGAKERGKYKVRHDTWKAAVNNDGSFLKR